MPVAKSCSSGSIRGCSVRVAARIGVALDLEQVRELSVEAEFPEQSLSELLDDRDDAEELHLWGVFISSVPKP